VDHVDPRQHLEHFTHQMACRPHSTRSEIDLARIGFGVGNELRERLCWNQGMNNDDVWQPHEAGDRRDVSNDVDVIVEG
jgi:hypothetical protein